MKRKLLGLMMAVVAALPVFVNAEGNSVKIGTTEYPTLKEAVEAAPTCAEESCKTTITVVADHTTAGIKFTEGKYIEIDLGGFTVSFKEPTVGSKGTETQDMQILKNSTITFKNGKFVSSNTASSKMFIQNYANLTLKDVEIDATNELSQYALSNNSGTVSIEGKTSIKSNAVAFDVYGYYAGGYPSGPQVTVDTTGTIEGTIEVAKDSGTATRELSLVIKNINHIGELSIQDGLEDNVTVENGSYTDKNIASAITPAEGSEVYEVVTAEGEIKYIVAEETEVEEGYFGLGFDKEGFEEVFRSNDDYKEVMGLIEEKLAQKYNAAIYYEMIYGGLLDGNLITDETLVKTELDEAVKVTLDIPETIEKVKDGYTRKYVVIRVHENKDGKYETTVLDAKDNEDGTVTFETDRFSTYVLAYEDVKEEEVKTQEIDEGPGTFDGISLYMIVAIASLIGIGGLAVYTKKAKNY